MKTDEIPWEEVLIRAQTLRSFKQKDGMKASDLPCNSDGKTYHEGENANCPATKSPVYNIIPTSITEASRVPIDMEQRKKIRLDISSRITSDV